MSRPKVIQTLATVLARTDEVGECLEWQGIMANATPQIRIDRKMRMVRRVIREFQGKPPRAGNFLAASCGNPKCVRPEHIVERTPSQHMYVMAVNVEHNHPLRIARLQKAAEDRRILDEQGLLMILTDGRTARELAAELGCSKSLVNKVRRGAAYRQVNATANPFVGLLR